MSNYDNWKTNDYDYQADMDDADYRLQELNNQLAELEDARVEAEDDNDDDELEQIQALIFDVRGEITNLKRKLGITEF